MKTTTASLVVLAAAVAAAPAFAQRSPRGSATAEVAGGKVTVDYGRPALKGRSVEELLKQLPPDRIWRAGENQVTTFETEGDVLVGGRKVPAGKYSVYVHARETGAWDFVLNKDQGEPLGRMFPQVPENAKAQLWPHYMDYTKAIGASELVRVPMAQSKSAQPTDLFTMSFTPKGRGQELTLAWGKEAWSVEILPAK